MSAPALPLALAGHAPGLRATGTRDGGLARIPSAEAPDPTDLADFWAVSAGAHSWHSLQPEKRLLLALLADALHSLELGRRVAKPKRLAAYTEARAWVLADAPGWFVTFGTVVSVFGLDPEAARTAVIARFRLGSPHERSMPTKSYPPTSGAPRRFTTAGSARRRGAGAPASGAAAPRSVVPPGA